MNIVIAGAGMIGKERIKAVEKLGENIVAVVDPLMPSMLKSGYSVYPSLYEALSGFSKLDCKVDWVFICTPHDQTVGIAKSALVRGANILSEKPLGRDLDEYYEIAEEKGSNQTVNVGFNYRFYKGINQLLIDVYNHKFGDIISVNMILGLSNAPGTEKTWRLDPIRAGSGSLIYAGIHLIDLAMLISNGTLKLKSFIPLSGYWKTGIEEECHILATDSNNAIYNIQSSVTRWRSAFRIEVNGTDGYGIVEGRNKYYGNQRYWTGKRWGWMSGKSQRDSEEVIVNYDGEDSFIEETKAVLFGTTSIIKPATHLDNKKCLEFISLMQ